MRTTTQHIKRHIEYIERHTNYKIIEGNTYYIGTKTCYTVTLNDEPKAVIISNNNSDIWDMLEPFWHEGFINDCNERGL